MWVELSKVGESAETGFVEVEVVVVEAETIVAEIETLLGKGVDGGRSRSILASESDGKLGIKIAQFYLIKSFLRAERDSKLTVTQSSTGVDTGDKSFTFGVVVVCVPSEPDLIEQIKGKEGEQGESNFLPGKSESVIERGNRFGLVNLSGKSKEKEK